MSRPVNLFSPIRDLIQVFSLLRDEKLRSALAVLTGKVKSMVKNALIKGNIGHGTGTGCRAGNKFTSRTQVYIKNSLTFKIFAHF